GARASPRLQWRSPGLNRSDQPQSTLRPSDPRASLSPAVRSRRAPFGYDAYRDWPLSGSRFERGFREDHRRRDRFDRDALGSRFRGRGSLAPYGFDRHFDRFGDRYHPYGFDWRSAPYVEYGAFNGWYGYGGSGWDRRSEERRVGE